MDAECLLHGYGASGTDPTLPDRAEAKMRLADEYDAAQDRGEVATRQNNPGSAGYVVGSNVPATAVDLGIRRDEIR